MEFKWGTARHGTNGEGGTGPDVHEVRQLSPAADKKRALTQDLMERVASLANLREAVNRVIRNRGAAGADGMTVGDLKGWFPGNWGSASGAVGNRAIPSPACIGSGNSQAGRRDETAGHSDSD
jgi:hypothetical protein